MPTGIYERPPIVADRLRWLAPHADGFRTWLEQKGYSAVTIVELVRLLSRWAEWVRDAGFQFDTIEAGFVASAEVFTGGRTLRAPQGAASLFLDYHFASERGDTHVRASTALAWIAQAASTPVARNRRWTDLVLFARFLHAEDTGHELPPAGMFPIRISRPTPYIYSPDEIARILDAAGELRPQKPNPLRRAIYVTVIGLIAATGLRFSEATMLRFEDLKPGGVLHIRESKFGKSRLVPLHPTVAEALECYLKLRRRIAGECEYLFPSVRHGALCSSTVNYTFRCLLRRAGIAPDRAKQPRIHDLRHTFATRVLEQCCAERGAVARHFVALSTYLGHADIRHTYWYLEATPELMTDIAAAAEKLVMSGAA